MSSTASNEPTGLEVVQSIEGQLRSLILQREIAEARTTTPEELAAERRVTAVVLKRCQEIVGELASIVDGLLQPADAAAGAVEAGPPRG